MNKLFTKIAALALGATMAVGVGVAVSSTSKDVKPVEAASAWQAHTGAITAGNEYLIVSVSGTYCMVPANTSSTGTTTRNAGGYSATSFTAASGPDMGFVFADAGSGNFYIKDGACFVRANGTTNNGLASATSNSTNPSYGTWIVTETSTSGQYTLINTNGTGRQISLYQTTNWRSYATNSGNKTNVKLYEKAKTAQTITASADSAYSDESVTLTTNATSATWSITSGASYAHLSSTSGKSVSLVGDAAGSVTVKAVASGYTDATKTITFSERPTGTYYDVTFNSNGGSSSPAKESIKENETFTFPSPGTKTHYSFLGWSSDGGTTKYATGATSPAVTSDITYTAYWQEDAKYTVTYVKGDHGTGSNYVVSNQYAGSYTLATFATAGFTVDDGYKFSKWSVGGVQYSEGASITLSANTTVTAIYSEIVAYTLVTDPSTLKDGTEFVLVDYVSSTYRIARDLNSGHIKMNTVTSATTVSGTTAGSTVETEEADVFTLVGSTGAWEIKRGDTYLQFTGTSNGNDSFTSTSSADTKFSIVTSSTSNKLTINSNSRSSRALRYNTSTGDLRNYSNTGSQLDLYMYAIIPASNELDSVTTSGQNASFTAGNKWSYGGTLTAHYTLEADATVTPTSFKFGASGINPTTAGTAITTSTTLTKAEHDGKYIYVIYTEDDITKYCSYQITVNYAAVTSVVIDTHAAEIGLNETYDYTLVGVTVNTSYADPGYEWIVHANTVGDDYTFNGSELRSKDTEGTITLWCRSTADNSKYDELVVTVTGDPTAAFDKESTSGYAGKTEVIEFTYGNMSDVSKITVASSNTSYVSVEDDLIAEDGVGLVTINFVAEGSANVTISYDGGSTLDTLTVTVNADSVSSISVKTNPTKTTYTVGETFSATGLVISANMASGDTVDLASNQYNLINAPTVLNDRGVQTITVELVADTTKTTSFNITVNMPSGLKIVTKTSNNDGGYEATLLTSSNTLSAGMKVAIGSSTKEDLMGTYGTGNNVKPLSGDGITVTYDSTNSKYTFDGTGANAAVYTLGGNSSDGWTFTDSSGNYLYKPTGTNNYMKAASSTDNNILWDISLDAEGVATITNKGNTTNNLMARNKTSDLYSCYASTSTAIVGIELYQVSELDPTYSYNAIDLSETIYDFIRVVYNNSDYYTCQSGGEGSSLTNWSNITSNAKYTALTSADKQNLANAVVSSPDGTKNSSEMVADFLSQYDYVVWKYGKSYDYLGRVDAGTASVRQSINLLSVMMGENTNTVAIIVIISMVSVTAIGGYFLLRKRKEN